MKFRNPWIDPRIVRVRLEDVQAYLTRHGWTCVGPATDSSLLRYERVEENEDAPTLFVPERIAEKGASLERLIELIGDLARFEDRWAGEVLSDMLQSATVEAGSANGTTLSTRTEPATR